MIGITGNIAAGKSVVSQYLQNLGVMCIDADVLAQRAISKGTPGYNCVLQAFGAEILDKNQHIDRQALAHIVFSDQQQLELLEACIHPFVTAAIDRIIAHTNTAVIAVEAIKLFEAGLAARCDSVWTVAADNEVRLERLIRERKMSAAAAQTRLDAQPPQEEKIAKSDVVIRTDGSFTETLQQVKSSFAAFSPVLVVDSFSNLLTENCALRQLRLADIPSAGNFWENVTGSPIPEEILCEQFGKYGYWGIFFNGNLEHMLTVKQTIGFAYVKDSNSLRNTVKSICTALPETIHTLKLRLQQEWVEVLCFNPDLLLADVVYAAGGGYNEISSLYYGYRSMLLKHRTKQDQVITLRTINSKEFEKLFEI